MAKLSAAAPVEARAWSSGWPFPLGMIGGPGRGAALVERLAALVERPAVPGRDDRRPWSSGRLPAAAKSMSWMIPFQRKTLSSVIGFRPAVGTLPSAQPAGMLSARNARARRLLTGWGLGPADPAHGKTRLDSAGSFNFRIVGLDTRSACQASLLSGFARPFAGDDDLALVLQAAEGRFDLAHER